MAKDRPSAAKVQAAAEYKEIVVQREYSTAPDHVTVYSDQINVASTGTVVIVSVYETIPGHPDEVQPRALSSRRVTLIINPTHARQLGKILIQHGDVMVERQVNESKKE